MLKYLINPMVQWTVTHGQQDIFTADLVTSLVADVFGHVTQNSDGVVLNEHLQVEVIQLCGAIIQHAHHHFVDHKKELIGFIWYVCAARHMNALLCMTPH